MLGIALPFSLGFTDLKRFYYSQFLRLRVI
nr:MAG TPA: hypothetical protein [Caudoviricetes sp.]